MKERKKRRRTGCLTCRARRVKCDEAKPECQRCLASNVECRGYQQKRQIETRASPSHPRLRVEESIEDFNDRSGQPVTCSPIVQMGLVGMPSIPKASQRPHTRARPILAYHQYLFRTAAILFPPKHSYFWKTWFCEEAWESEYAFDTIVAIGTVHRACLLMGGSDENAVGRSLDTRVIAEQAYTKALQELSPCFERPEALTFAHIAAILLLAYYECFVSNLPAAYQCLRIAIDSTALLKDRGSQEHLSIEPIQECMFRMSRHLNSILPLSKLGLSFRPVAPIALGTPRDTFSSTYSGSHPSLTALRIDLHDLSAATPEIWDLVWNSQGIRGGSLSRDQIHAFEEQVKRWRNTHLDRLPCFYSENDDAIDLKNGRNTIDGLQFPPKVRPATLVEVCIMETMCELYFARAKWALCISDHDNEIHELYAYIHCYQALSWIGSAASCKETAHETYPESSRQPCEILEFGFLPILYLIGQMSPKLEWLEWIIERMENIGREGLYNGNALAKSLRILILFEMRNTLSTSSVLKHFPPPRQRIICILIPEPEGHEFTAYYGGAASNTNQDTPYVRFPLGRAHWSNDHYNMAGKPDIDFFIDQQISAEPLTEEWLLAQKPLQKWKNLAGVANFNLDHLVSEHINNSQILRHGSQPSEFQTVRRYVAVDLPSLTDLSAV